jgi:hypothetical protein
MPDFDPYSPDVNTRTDAYLPPEETPIETPQEQGLPNNPSAWDSSYQDYYSNLLADAFSVAGLSDSSSSITKDIMQRFAGPTAAAKAPDEEGLVDRVKKSIGTGLDWIEKNPKASQLLLGAVGGAYQAAEKKKAAAQLVQDEKDKIAANSASLTGLRPVKRGLINQPLTRIGGAKVFNNAGRI